MDQMISVNEVFKTLGQPETTYVERDDGKYERKLSSALRAKGQICLLTGPSKTGKTTLWRKVLSDKKLDPIRVSCNASITASEFWKIALEEINFERLSSVQKNKGRKVSGMGKVSGKIGWPLLASVIGETSLGIDSSMNDVQIREKILSQPAPKHLIPVLRDYPMVLVVEDFHYLNDEVKKNVFQEWKVFVDSEVSAIVVGTTHHAVDLAYANRDLVARTKQLDLSRWSESDLEKIALQGFKYLGIQVPKPVIKVIADESAGLPIIVQAVCSQMLLNKGIETVEQGNNQVRFDKKDVYEALHTVAIEDYGQFETFYERLSSGPRTGARKYDTYKLVLSLFAAEDSLTFAFKRNEIQERLRKLPVSKSERPPAQAVTGMLKGLAGFQVSLGYTLLEWNESDQRLHILEPSFLFYLRWREGRQAPPSFRDLLSALFPGFFKNSTNSLRQ